MTDPKLAYGCCRRCLNMVDLTCVDTGCPCHDGERGPDSIFDDDSYWINQREADDYRNEGTDE